MSDWDLTEKRIYKLLRHPYQLDKSVVEDMASAYLEFVEELFDYLNRIGDNKIRIRQLNMSYIDFGTLKALEESCPTENSKLKLVFLDKLLSLINMEQELIYRQMEYPKFFINIESEWKSPFYLGEFYQFNLSSCIRQQNSLTAQFVSFSLSNLANIFYPPQFLQ